MRKKISRNNFVIYILAIAGLLTTSCKQSNDASKNKFAIIDNTIGSVFAELKRVEFLTKHIHKKNWQIVYGFACDNPLCSNSTIPYKDKKLLTITEKRKHRVIAGYLEDKITWALTRWLAPLNQLKLGKKIINQQDFKFTELTPEPDKLSSSGFIYTPEQLKANNLLATTDLVVIIGGRTSYACPQRSWELFPPPLRLPPFVYLRHDIGLSDAGVTRRWEHFLLHEMGHAFGLMDTYPNAWLDTQGQSASVMNIVLRDNQAPPSLAIDDIKGIEWLYYFYHDQQKLTDNKCVFDNYEQVAEGVCRPVYPVIHEVQQAYFKEQHGKTNESKVFMTSAVKIGNLLQNKKRDNNGRTALHYAVIHQGESVAMKMAWTQTIKSLLKVGFDKKTKDNGGKIACDYLQCKENGRMCGELRNLLC